jgi:threonine aldolase
MLGKEAAVFVPSGTFGNQLALFSWCPRGTEVVLMEESHIVQHEAGAASIIAGVQTRAVPSPRGVFEPGALRKRLRKRELHEPATSLICVENASAGGRAIPLAELDAVRDIAREWGLPLHMDGARIFNAALALQTSAAEIAARADSVMVCLSKGLCAPVGSLLAGPRAFVEEARMKRKIMGGGMRQAGILAASGIVALTKHTALLAEDHKRAKALAAGLAAIAGIEIDRDSVDINMVFFSWPPARDADKAQAAVDAFLRAGIRINAPERTPEAGLFRFVTHYWTGDAEVGAILRAAQEAFQS